MSDSVLLRFRDFNNETIAEHNNVVRESESHTCLWGWWKKGLEVLPEPGLVVFAEDVNKDPGRERAYFLNSSNGKLYAAKLYKVHYEQGGREQRAPETAPRCPTYYARRECPAWFEIGEIRDVPEGIGALKEYVWSPNNRSVRSRRVVALRNYTRPSSALLDEEIGQYVVDDNFLETNVSLWLITESDEQHLLGRNHVALPLSRGLRKARGKYALHLSDLHFGANHGFRNELATPKTGKTAKERLSDSLLADLETLDVLSDIALVWVTGDVTWAGEVHEFANSVEFLRTLRRRLGLHRAQVSLVPGNHDIEWRRAGTEEIDPNAELNFSDFCQKVYGVPPVSSFLRCHTFDVGGKNFTVIGLNSCRIESEENAGLGFVGREQLRELANFLGERKRSDERRVALVHHHLVPVNHQEEIEWTRKKVSLMLDAEGVIRTLLGMDVDLVVHGHQHQPFVSREWRMVPDFVCPLTGEKRDLEEQLTIVGGGSAGVRRSHLNQIGRNCYNLIDLSDQKLRMRTRMASSSGPGYVDYINRPLLP